MRLAVILICALACACPAVLSAQGADDSARRITSKPEYRGYRVERRPGADPSSWNPESSSRDGSGSRGNGWGSGSSGGPPRRGATPGSSSGGGSPSMGSMPAWIGAVFQVIAYIVIIVGVAVALFFIVKALLGIRFRKRAKSQKKKARRQETPESETGPGEEEIEIDEQVFEDALELARREYDQAIRQGDYARATLLAYRIFWLQAGWQGCVEQSDKRTWRDALRMVRQTENRRRVRELLPLVERVRYADHHPDQAEFNEWRKRIELVDPEGVLK